MSKILAHQVSYFLNLALRTKMDRFTISICGSKLMLTATATDRAVYVQSSTEKDRKCDKHQKMDYNFSKDQIKSMAKFFGVQAPLDVVTVAHTPADLGLTFQANGKNLDLVNQRGEPLDFTVKAVSGFVTVDKDMLSGALRQLIPYNLNRISLSVRDRLLTLKDMSLKDMSLSVLRASSPDVSIDASVNDAAYLYNAVLTMREDWGDITMCLGTCLGQQYLCLKHSNHGIFLPIVK